MSETTEEKQPNNEQTEQATENEAPTEQTDSQDAPENDKLNFDALQSELNSHNEQLLRLQADLQNQQRRAQRDIANAHKFALEGFVNELIPVVDSLEQGIQNSASEDESIKQGMELTLSMLLAALKKFGVEQLNPLHETFNPEHHEAMTMVENGEHKPNTVIDVFQKGYTLNERLVRPARVIVSRASSDAKT